MHGCRSPLGERFFYETFESHGFHDFKRLVGGFEEGFYVERYAAAQC